MSEQEQQKKVQDALEVNLRLHPQQLELGQAEMLTDALLHRFDDLEQRLNTYISGAAGGEKLRKGMQSYLSRLNANPLIPLHFRLKVLKRFEEQLDLFDAEMTAAILNAHKIGIDMVQKEAQSEPGYYSILVDMVSHAIELAGMLMRDLLAEYQSAGVITVRQVFDLMRLGMAVLPELSDDAEVEKRRLYVAILRYEMLRNLDFFSLTKEEQTMVMDELKHHISSMVPYYLAKGAVKSADIQGYSLLVTNLSRPHDTAKVLPFPSNTNASDYIIVPLDDFLDKLVTSIDRAEKVMNDPLLQSKDIQIETSLKTTVVGGNAILDALRTKSRGVERQEYGNAKLAVDWSLKKTMDKTTEDEPESTGGLLQQSIDVDVIPPSVKDTWSVLNISKKGIAIERLGTEKPEKGIGYLVGLEWLPHRGEPLYAFIRWIRFPKPGEQQIGLEFYLRQHIPLRAVMLSVGDTDDSRFWSVLATFDESGEHTFLFPDSHVFKGMVFSLGMEKYGGYYKVVEVLDQGPNYSVCNVNVAAELDTHQVDAQASSK
jgi:hypothetical protein